MKFPGPLLAERWRLGPRLGSGSQAHTYLALDTRSSSERVVVVKQLRLRDLAGGAKRGGWKKFDLFEREIRVLESLSHPSIPRFLDSFESEPGVFNLVMEKAPGATLRAIATKVRFTDLELRDLMIRVLDVLRYLHGLNPPVIHRDIKPANIVRSATGAVALVDFGGVRDALREEGGSTVVGTFGYMAPEQLHGQATPATDIYGLGATIVSLAGGVEPERVPRRGLRMDLAKHLAHTEPSLLRLLEKMIEPDPDARPQSAMDVLALLQRSKRAIETIAMAPPAPTALTRTAKPSIPVEIAEQTTDALQEVPRPLRLLMRGLLLLIGVGGYVGLTVVRAALLPVVFALVSAFSRDDKKPGIEGTKQKIEGALDEGRDGFLALQRSGTRRTKALPPAKK